MVIQRRAHLRTPPGSLIERIAYNQTPVYSGAAYSSDIETGLAAGAQGYVVKPADLDELELTIRRLIEGTPDTVTSLIFL